MTWTAVANKNREMEISGKMPLITFFKIGMRKKMKKNGYGQEEVRNQGLKGPRCTGTCPQTLGTFDQKIGYRGKCIKYKK